MLKNTTVKNKKNILLTGGTGFIGNHLTNLLLDEGFSVSILTRSKRKNTREVTYYTWDVQKKEIENEAILRADYIIHLAGTSIAGARWTEKRKKEIVASREDSLQLLYNSLQKNNKILDGFISASAVGIYGAYTSEQICHEENPPATDFLGQVCEKWEAAADTIAAMGVRTVKIRTGLVLGKDGGFLKPLTPVFKYGFGAALGSGKQYMPWIHLEDLSRIYVHAIKTNTMSGPYNAAVGDSNTNTNFSKKMCAVYGYKMWLPNVPAFILKLALGEMSDLLLKGQRVSSQKIENTDFIFRYKSIEEALRDSLS
ncbi:Epimerase family protein [Flavobacterium sp. TAB 87]|nr:Epimerase family protein [Flavobacterium sp. TAB 87]